jgi:hypothetical protein
MEYALKTSPFRRRVAAVRERVEPHLPRDRLVEIAAYHAERPFGRHKPHYVDFEHALATGYKDIVHANLDLVSGSSTSAPARATSRSRSSGSDTTSRPPRCPPTKA